MSHLVFVQRTFTTRAQAQSYFDSLRPTAWPYAWCTEDPQGQRWIVTALVETVQFRIVPSS